MDPLTLLREFVSGGKIDEVVLEGDRVDFGGRYSFPKSAPTSYKSNQGKGEFYPLESLLFYARTTQGEGSVKFAEYFRRAREAGLTPIGFLDGKDLSDYLTGAIDRSEYIHLALPDLQVDNLEQPSKRVRLDGGEAGPSSAAAAAGGQAEEGEAAEQSALRQILANECQLRDRNSMLVVPGRSFHKVLGALQQVQREQEREQERRHKERQHQQKAHKAVLPVKPSGRYERQTQQDATLKQMGAAELGVQVAFKPSSSAAAAAPMPPAAESNGVPPPPPPPTAAQPPPPPPSSSRPQQQQQQQRQRPPSGSSSQQRRGPPPPGTARSGAPVRVGTPIILVPPGGTGLLNMLNICPFLEEGKFLTAEACQEQAAKEAAEREAGGEGGKKPSHKAERISIQRTIGRTTPVKYYVTDREPSRKEEWDKVAAVFCLGKAWQFKKWPFKGAAQGDLVETFSSMQGVHFYYADDRVDPVVKSWNVKLLPLNRESRHQDIIVAQEFWRLLDTHMQTKRSSLAY